MFFSLLFAGMKVLGVEEEEYCYIPMGGELPDLAQRVVGFGGAANMVHPATGAVVCSTVYSISRHENSAVECRCTAMLTEGPLQCYVLRWLPM
jgi:Lycopene cyclase protein